MSAGERLSVIDTLCDGTPALTPFALFVPPTFCTVVCNRTMMQKFCATPRAPRFPSSPKARLQKASYERIIQSSLRFTNAQSSVKILYCRSTSTPFASSYQHYHQQQNQLHRRSPNAHPSLPTCRVPPAAQSAPARPPPAQARQIGAAVILTPSQTSHRSKFREKKREKTER